MNLTPYLKQIKHLVTDNSPLILTVVGVGGTITTAVLTAKATFKASDVLGNTVLEPMGNGEHGISTKRAVKAVWTLYIPAAVAGFGTCACIVAANRIGTQRAAALATAVTLSERALSQYKEKVLEQIGPDEERKLRETLVKARARGEEPQILEVVPDSNDVLCEDAYSARYIMSTEEKLTKATIDMFRQIRDDGFATISDFYDRIGLPHTSISDEFGWNESVDFDLDFTPVKLENGMLCLSFDFVERPTLRPWSVASFRN